GSPTMPPCAASCTPGQYDWGSAYFPAGAFDPNHLNVSTADGDALYTTQVPLAVALAEVSSTQDLWVARFKFIVIAGTGDTDITFQDCFEGVENSTFTRVISVSADVVTGELSDLTISTGASCTDDLCADGDFCNGEEYCSTPSCTPGEPDCCLPGEFPCDDGSECTTDSCNETDDTCSNPPNYNPDFYCCDPLTSDLTTINDSNPCTDDVCDPFTGAVTHDPFPQGTNCSDGDPCTENDVCDGAGNCAGTPIDPCPGCVADADCNDFVPCTLDVCFGAPAGICRNTPDDSLCPDDGLYCNGEEICDSELGCVHVGAPCPTCTEGEPCPCETADLRSGGPRYLAIRPKPLESDVPVKLRVTSDELPCLDKYVGVLECGGDGDACRTDADCNGCSITTLPCLADEDCDFGECSDGRECSVALNNCDEGVCVRIESCVISGDLCEPAPLKSFDVNNDGLPDGTLAVLVDDPGLATELTPAEWTAGVMRCSKSAVPCEDNGDDDCRRGYCSLYGSVCDYLLQNCHGEGETCILNEECVSGAVYVYGSDIRPSDFDIPTQTALPIGYNVQAECMADPADDPEPASVTMWRWGDTNNDTYLSVSDIHMVILAIQGFYDYSTIVTDDQAGIDPCLPQQVLNVLDTFTVVQAVEGTKFRDIAACSDVCP
ncbi:MAG: hypothetical protein JSU63_19535, partial [Phycisphaerales bacterium]